MPEIKEDPFTGSVQETESSRRLTSTKGDFYQMKKLLMLCGMSAAVLYAGTVILGGFLRSNAI